MSTAHTNRKSFTAHCPHCGVKVRAQNQHDLQHGSCPNCSLPLGQSPTAGAEPSSRRDWYVLIGASCLIIAIGIGYLTKQLYSTKPATNTVAPVAPARQVHAVLADGAADQVHQQANRQVQEVAAVHEKAEPQDKQKAPRPPAQLGWKAKAIAKSVQKIKDRNNTTRLAHRGKLEAAKTAIIELETTLWPESKPFVPIPELVKILQERSDPPEDLRSNRSNLAQATLRFLPKLGSEAHVAIPAIAEVAQNDKHLRPDALTALLCFGENAIPSLEELLKHEDAQLRAEILHAFKHSLVLGTNLRKVRDQLLVKHDPKPKLFETRQKKFLLDQTDVTKTVQSIEAMVSELTEIRFETWGRRSRRRKYANPKNILNNADKTIRQEVEAAVGTKVTWRLRVSDIESELVGGRSTGTFYLGKTGGNNIYRGIRLQYPVRGSNVRIKIAHHPSGSGGYNPDHLAAGIHVSAEVLPSILPGDPITITGVFANLQFDKVGNPHICLDHVQATPAPWDESLDGKRFVFNPHDLQATVKSFKEARATSAEKPPWQGVFRLRILSRIPRNAKIKWQFQVEKINVKNTGQIQSISLKKVPRAVVTIPHPRYNPFSIGVKQFTGFGGVAYQMLVGLHISEKQAIHLRKGDSITITATVSGANVDKGTIRFDLDNVKVITRDR